MSYDGQSTDDFGFNNEIIIKRAKHDIICMFDGIEFCSRSAMRWSCRLGSSASSFSLGGMKNIKRHLLSIFLRLIPMCVRGSVHKKMIDVCLPIILYVLSLVYYELFKKE